MRSTAKEWTLVVDQESKFYNFAGFSTLNRLILLYLKAKNDNKNENNFYQERICFEYFIDWKPLFSTSHFKQIVITAYLVKALEYILSNTHVITEGARELRYEMVSPSPTSELSIAIGAPLQMF